MIMRVRAPLWRSTFWNLRDVKDGSNSVLKITIDTRRRNKSRCELNHERILNQNIDMQVPVFKKNFTYDIFFNPILLNLNYVMGYLYIDTR